jgi:hypothetical protein
VQHQLERTQRQVDRYAMELQRHGVESVEREVRWLSDLIKAERRDDENPRPDEDPLDIDPVPHTQPPRR